MVELRTREQRAPAAAAIEAAVDVVVRLVAAERAGDDHVRVVGLHRDGAPAEATVAGGTPHRRDVFPAIAGRIEAPHRTVGHVVRAGFVAVAEQPASARIAHHVAGTQADRLAGHRLPARAAIARAEQAGLLRGHAGIQRRRRVAARTAGGIEYHEGDADRAQIAPARGPCRTGLRDRGEALHLAPLRTGIVAAPQAVGARAEHQHAAVVGIDGQALAIAAPLFVAAELERQRRPLEGSATIGRAQDRAVLPTLVQVGADGQVETIGIGRIHGQAFDAEAPAVVVPHPVHQRLPATLARQPAVGATDVGARVQQPLLVRMEHQAADETATADRDIAPVVVGDVVLRRRAGHQQENGKREDQAKREHGISCRGEQPVRRQDAHRLRRNDRQRAGRSARHSIRT
jgi:hypothetical protein